MDRYCIVMTSSQPYQLASEMSINYRGYYPEQLAEMMAKVAYIDVIDQTSRPGEQAIFLAKNKSNRICLSFISYKKD